MMRRAVLLSLILFWTAAGVVALWWLVNPPVEEVRQGTGLTREALVEHDDAESCWLLIDGAIYDVTDFIALHPGGADRILANCGKDASAAFASQGGRGEHSATAVSALENYRLGELFD